MVVVAQLVRAPDCGSGGRRFETDLPPLIKKPFCKRAFFFLIVSPYFLSLSNTNRFSLFATSHAV